ncbi:MAG: TIGR03085 family metal-binding protein [Micromonosporaceae bacterium]|jgi:uncharacterized protein (TIGR03085 family)
MARESYAASERQALCDLLTDLGPDQPTLCEGWTTRDLAAHLVARERRPLSSPGLVVPQLAGYTERVRRRLAARPYLELVALVRRPPAWVRLTPVDRAVNTMEMFLHHEDVRRGQPGWTPRDLPDGLARQLWRMLRIPARLRLRRFPAALEVSAPGLGRMRTGAGGEPLRLTGDVGELALFLSGRQRAARVRVEGPEDLVARLTTARLGW